MIFFFLLCYHHVLGNGKKIHKTKRENYVFRTQRAQYLSEKFAKCVSIYLMNPPVDFFHIKTLVLSLWTNFYKFCLFFLFSIEKHTHRDIFFNLFSSNYFYFCSFEVVFLGSEYGQQKPYCQLEYIYSLSEILSFQTQAFK